MFTHSHGARLLALAVAAFLSLAALPLQPALADVTGLVRGHVTVDDGAKSGIQITLIGEGTRASSTTDTDGNFTSSRVPFGHYTIVAHSEGQPDVEQTIDVQTDSVATVTLAVHRLTQIGRVAGTTRGVSGTPVSATTLGRAAIEAAPQSRNLNRLIETVPGIVAFSYDEPVAHGFHGLTYEIDGAPLPQTTSASFSELLDPRNVDSVEIFTGAFPAEFGGQRQGAVINIVTKRDSDIPNGSQTLLSTGIGTYGSSFGSFSEALRAGSTRVFLNYNSQRTNRGLDAPTPDAIHDRGSLSDGFLRTVTTLGPRDTVAFDFSSQYNTYQIPINTIAGPNDAIVDLPGQDDTQREYNAFANLSYTHTARDGSGFLQVIPWWRYARIIYGGDLANDVLALDTSPNDCGGSAPCSLAGLSQDRQARAFGLRTALFRTFGTHALKAGVEGSSENFTSAETIAQPGNPSFFDNAMQHGTGFAAYAQDTWTPSPWLSLQLGLRYDRSTGFVAGNELQPRVGVNVRVGPQTLLHAYYGRIYAAPALEDTRRDAVVAGGGSAAAPLPIYDLKPEHDSYYELGVAQTFRGGLSGSLNLWQRNVWDVLDTTQIFPTPIFATFNNALGLAHGVELRLDRRSAAASWYLSATYSQSVAGGISGGTFLFAPAQLSNTSLNPEDHDQSVAVKDAYTRRFGSDGRSYVTLGSDYGTGYPVQFQNGAGRLLPHLTFDAAFGRTPRPGSLGFSLTALNFTDHRYLLKVNNGFNTTQWAPGAQVTFALQAAM
jgi:outer membrane receptor protein involved in Fe transport